MKIIVITGASSGLGIEFCKLAAEEKEIDEIWLIARREDRLRAIASTFPEGKCVPVVLDLSKEESFDAYRAMLAEKQADVRMLINNAGMGVLGNIAESDLSGQLRMVDVNIRALTALTTVTLPFMNKGARIINTCSIASFVPNPRLTVYSSTKAYVLSYTKGLRYELKKQGINVTAVCPGPMRTEFLSVAGITEENSKTFAILPYCDPAKVAKMAFRASSRGRCVYTPRGFYKFYRFVAKIVPHNWLLPISKA